MLIGIINTVYAVDVGIVVEFNDSNVKTDCVNVPSETDGFEILEKSIFDILWSPEGAFGQLACKINDEGTNVAGTFCEYFGDFWNFNILPNGNNQWIHSPVGHNGPGGCWNRNVLSFGGHYCGADKDVIGYKFGSAGYEPSLKTYKQVCEKLKVKDIKVYVDGKKEAGADEDGGKIDAVPGSKLELKIKLENLYTDDEDVEINDITVEGTLEGIDDGDDLEDDVNDFDLNPEKDREISLEFNIPLEVEDDEYDLIVEIEGENERSFPYSKKIEFEVEVEKEKHDVIFNKLEFEGNNIQCDGSANLKVNAVNLGVENEDVKIVISNQELDINIQESFELSEDPFDKDNSFSKTYGVILPADINPGAYIFRADLFYGSNIESSTAELIIECGGNILGLEEKSKGTEETFQTQNVQTPKIIPTSIDLVGAAVSNTAEEKNFSNADILTITTLTAGVIIIITGIILLVILLRE